MWIFFYQKTTKNYRKEVNFFMGQLVYMLVNTKLKCTTYKNVFTYLFPIPANVHSTSRSQMLMDSDKEQCSIVVRQNILLTEANICT